MTTAGEVIGLFLSEEIPRGMSMADTIAAIREQDGIVYLPHPFDRLHSIPDSRTLHAHLGDLDVFEVYNAKLLLDGFNDEALRFARKYNLTMGAGSDAHVLQAIGTGGVRMRAFETPEEFLIGMRTAEILRRPKSLVYLQGLKWMAQARDAALERARAASGRNRRERTANYPLSRPLPAQTNDISERYLRKAIAEMNDLGHEIAEAAGPDRAPVLGSGHPLADLFLLKHRPQASELHEGVAFFGRAGQAILKSLQRLRVDPTAIYGTNCLKYEDEPEETHALARARAPHRPAEARRGPRARCARVPERRPVPPGERGGGPAGGDPALHADGGGARLPGHRRGARRPGGQAGLLGELQGDRALVVRAAAVLARRDRARRLRRRPRAPPEPLGLGRRRVSRLRRHPAHVLARLARAPLAGAGPARSGSGSSRSGSWLLSVAFSLADLDIAANLTKLAAATAVGWWFLTFFEAAWWVALIAVLIVPVDLDLGRPRADEDDHGGAARGLRRAQRRDADRGRGRLRAARPARTSSSSRSSSARRPASACGPA